MCAIDALGIAAMTGHDVSISAADPVSGQLITVEHTAGRWHWNPPATTVLVAQPIDTAEPSPVSAECICPHINFITARPHADAYLDGHLGLTGALLDHHSALGLADALFAPLLRTTEPGHSTTRTER